MAFAPIRRPRLNQPTGEGIDWANPLTKGLIHLSMPGVFFASSKNLVNGKKNSSSGSPNKVFTMSGVAAHFGNNIAHRIVYQNDYSGNMTLVAICVPTSIATSCIFGVFYPANANAVSNYLSIESGPAISAVSTDNSNWSIASGRAPVSGETLILGASFAQGGGRSLFINGVNAATNSTARSPSGMTEFIEGAYNGGIISGYLSPFSGEIVLSMASNRLWSAREHATFSANPWQIFL